MASETLSQNDIDALLKRGGGAAAARAAFKPAQDVQVYDFRRPHRISKERLRTIEAMYERLAKSLEAWLIGRVRRQVELKLQSVEQYSFGEFTLSLSTPCASFGFDIKNIDGQKGVIDVGHEFAYFLVDRFFGGDAPAAMMQRSLTPIERLTVRIVVERIASLLSEIWVDHVQLDLDVTTFEAFPEMVQGVSREDPVLVANIEVAAENVRSLIILCLPLSVLEKFFVSGDKRRVRDMTGSTRDREAARVLTEASLRVMQVDVAARLPSFKVPLRQLLALPPGTVLQTSIPTDSELEILVGGQPRYKATSGRMGQKLAVRLTDAPEIPGSSSLPG